MSLSSLFNLPSAPNKLLTDNSNGAQNTPNSGGNSANSGGDAFASYMAQQLSSGQFANWQNLTSALASQNSLATQNSGFGPQPNGFSTSPTHNGTQHSQDNQTNSNSSSSGSSSASGTNGTNGTNGSESSNGSTNSANSSSTNQASNPSNHGKYRHYLGSTNILGDSLEGGSTGNAGSSSTSNGQGIPYSTNAWLMSNGSQGANDKVTDPSVSSKDGKLGDANSQNAASSLPNGLPIVLPSIGAALLAQQNALKGKDSATSPDSLNGHSLKTVSISNKIQLITPAQTDTSPQSLISYARGMGLNDSQMHQLFGAEAARQTPAGAASSQPASTESLISTGTTLPSTTADTTSTSSLDANSQALGTLSTGNTPSDATTSVLNQVSNLQIQINQAPGAIGIQSQATAATLAELNTKVAVSTSAGAVNGASGSASASPVSTLEALSVMEASLRPEDVEALQAHFANTTRSTNALGSTGNEGASGSITLDMNTALNSLNPEGLGSNLGGSSENSNNGTNSGSSSNPDGSQGNNNVPADMAGAYEKLSNKFAAEISNRLQQQFAQGQWKMKFALRPSSLGIVDIQLEMKDGKLAANFQSNNPLTQNLIHTNSHQLRNALQGSGIDQSSVQVGSGQTSGQGSGSSSGQNSGVPYSYQSNPSSSVAKVTEETPIADDTKQNALSSSNSQLDILA